MMLLILISAMLIAAGHPILGFVFFFIWTMAVIE